MVEGIQLNGAPTEQADHWKAPEIVESALQYTALTFRKAFDSNNKGGALQRLKDVIYSMRPLIEGQIRANAKTVKWYLSLNINFCKSTKPGVRTDGTVTFCSEIHWHPRFRLPIHVGCNQIA